VIDDDGEEDDEEDLADAVALMRAANHLYIYGWIDGERTEPSRRQAAQLDY